MSTRILWDATDNVAALYDSVTGLAFGEVFEGDNAYEDAERFVDWCLNWIKVDPRELPPTELIALRKTFLREKPVAA